MTLRLLVALAIGALATSGARAEEPQLAATYYGWYRWPDRHLGAGLPLRQRMVAPETAAPESSAWHARELEAAAAAGIDALLVANVPAPTRLDALFEALGRAVEERAAAGQPAVRIGVLLDPFLTAVDQSGGEEAASIRKLDLRDPATRNALLAPLDAFFAAIAPPHRALLDGAPLVVVGGDGAIAACPPDLFATIESEAIARFGVVPRFVLEQSWNDATRPAWRRGAALFGVQRTGAVATLGPGFVDGTAARGLVRPRADRAAFLTEAATLLSEPPALTVVESWNQLHDGSAVAPTLEEGWRYVAALRDFKAALREPARAAAWERGTPIAPLLEAAWVAERDAVLRDAVEWRPDGSGSGLALEAIGPAEAAAAVRWLPESGALALAAGATLRFRVAAAFGDDEAAARAVTCDGAPLDAAPGVTWSSDTPPQLELRFPAPFALQQVRVERSARRFPDGDLGLDDPFLFAASGDGGSDGLAAATARIAAAAKLGAQWLRFEVAWDALADGKGRCDFARVAALVAATRAAGLEPIVAITRPPRSVEPLGGHAGEIAAFCSALRAATGDSLRLLELFPGPNLPARGAVAPDVPGFVRVLRAVSTQLHRTAPELALLPGQLLGPDVAWWEAFHGQREPWLIDGGALAVDAAFGPAGSATCAKALARSLAAARAARPLPCFVTLGAEGDANAPAATDAAVAALLRTALERSGRADATLHLLDAGELPRVGGFTTERARRALAASGRPVVVAPPAALLPALAADEARVCVVAHGAWWPSELVAALPAWIDRGGLLVALGREPAARCATRALDGSFDEDDRAAGLQLRDDLRIAMTPWRGEDGTAAPRVRPGPTVPSLALPDGALPIATLFTRRTGEPRDPKGYHRYEALATAVDGDGREWGDVAALLHYMGGREGALLVIGLEGGDDAPDGAALAATTRTLRASVATTRSLHAIDEGGERTIALWRGVLDAAGGATERAAAFEALARAPSKARQK